MAQVHLSIIFELHDIKMMLLDVFEEQVDASGSHLNKRIVCASSIDDLMTAGRWGCDA